jgi:Bacteriocin-protection, YdeI or OmpD-Associated
MFSFANMRAVYPLPHVWKTFKTPVGFASDPTSCAGPASNAARTTGVTLSGVSTQRLPGGVVHKLPADLREALIANSEALAAWKDITPLARNEFICWVEDAKQEVTRKRRIRRTREELEEGQRRPCCWPGCKHRERTGR